MVLWGAALVLREEEEIRFDLVYAVAGARVRRVMFLVAAGALLALYAVSFPAVFDYVTFMKVESTAYLKISLVCLFSIYLVNRKSQPLNSRHSCGSRMPYPS